MKTDDFRPESFELLTEVTKLAYQHNISLRDAEVVPKLTKLVGETLAEALSNPIWLYGQRTQAMFEAMLVSLGGFRLLKAEDTSSVYPEGHFQAPDFRVVLEDGAQWLVEVKNIYCADPFQQRRKLMNRVYREKLERYASATGGHLKLAVFWAKWGIWTLVSPEPFIDTEGDVSLDMASGIVANELSRLGDLKIGTRPPLRFRLGVIREGAGLTCYEHTSEFTITDASLYCDHNEILDPVEKQVAWMLIRYGDWKSDGPCLVQLDNQREAVEFVFEPEEATKQGFEIIGDLSGIFSRYYAEQTLDNNNVHQIRGPIHPGWFAPINLSCYESKELPLWRFKQTPASLKNVANKSS